MFLWVGWMVGFAHVVLAGNGLHNLHEHRHSHSL